MSDKVTPINSNALVEFDTERELIDFFVAKQKQFIEDAGCPPTRIAVVLMGNDDDGRFRSIANSWDTREEHSTIENCSIASALLLHRAIGQ